MTINEWAKDFRSFVNELQMSRDDYKGIMEYIDDAIALLKEQEYKLDSIVVFENGDKVRIWHCPLCKSEVRFVLKGGDDDAKS